jgi:hypothetical protein
MLVTTYITCPLAVAEAFAHNLRPTTARAQAAKAKTEFSITRRLLTDSYEPDS